MSDRDSFLKAIRANPDDDLPRLVFADWLDENGESERAELIREQIYRFRRNPNYGPYRGLSRVPLPSRSGFCFYRRGFVDLATFFHFSAWVEHADAILADSVNLTVRLADVPAVESNDNIHFGINQTVHRLRDVPRNKFAFAGKVLPTGAPVTRQHLTDMLRHYWPAVKTWEMPAYPTRHAATATPRAGRRR